MQQRERTVNWRDNKRLQTLWSGTGVDAWRQWKCAQEGWPGAIKSRYSRTVSAGSSKETPLCTLSAMAGLDALLAGARVGQKSGSLERKYRRDSMCWGGGLGGGEATEKHNERKRHAGKQRKSLGECGLLYSPALAVIRQFVSVWPSAGRKCLLIVWNKPKVSAWAKEMERWMDEIKRPCD